jgi:hypothetical protein
MPIVRPLPETQGQTLHQPPEGALVAAQPFLDKIYCTGSIDIHILQGKHDLLELIHPPESLDLGRP